MDGTRQCIHCRSTSVVLVGDHAQGFSGGKAIAGALVAGPFGLLAGAMGKNKRDVYLRCDDCLRVFSAEEMRRAERKRKNLRQLGYVGGGFVVLMMFAHACGPGPALSHGAVTVAPVATQPAPVPSAAPVTQPHGRRTHHGRHPE